LTLFEGFTSERIDAGEAQIALVRGGEGPPVLLLHGYPQTHAMWHAVAPALAERFTVVAPDMRGYGDSSVPESDSSHAAYSFRAMARDQVEVMRSLGFSSWAVAGHDRGARVAHRMALDHPERVERLAVLDIVPTHLAFSKVDKAFATHTYHWFFLIQHEPLPERMIGCDPGFWVRSKLERWSGSGARVHPEALAEYERAFARPEVVHATCEDYRAGASIDLEHDEVDLGRRLDQPVLVLWGSEGRLPASFGDLLEVWGERAERVEGRELHCGHFLPEERPEETVEALRAFLSG
jgi:haloacetate dehalogenase